MKIGQAHATDFIKSHGREAVKQYLEYDAFNRMVVTYTALADARDGESCIRTDYAYAGTSTRVIKMKESLSIWQAAWDI